MKIAPLKIPVRKTKRFYWRSVLGFIALVIFVIKGLRYLGRRVSIK